MKFQFLIENKTNNPGVVAEHGLSIYIEKNGRKILFDAGATDLFTKNAKFLGIELSDIDIAVVSHGHYDHTGGFPEFCRMNKKASIYIQKNAFRESYGYENGELEKITSGIRWNPGERKEIEKRLILTDGSVMIDEDICITGSFPVCEGFEPTEKFYYRNEEGALVEDDMSHEQCLVIRGKDGIYIFSGCSHRGAISALNAGKSVFPGEPVAVFAAGMHLYSAPEECKERVIKELKGEKIGKIIPVHCTGINGICDFKNHFGDRCIAATAGDSFYGR